MRGLTTGRMRAGDVGFDISFDLVDHALVAPTAAGRGRSRCATGSRSHPGSCSLRGMGLDVTITPSRSACR
jgi:hypothetical protein